MRQHIARLSSHTTSGELDGEGFHEADGFEADAGDLAEEADDVFGVVGAVGGGADAGAGVAVNARVADLEKDGFAIAPSCWELIATCYYLQKDLFESAKRGLVPGG